MEPRSICRTCLGHAESSGLGDLIGERVAIGGVVVKRKGGGLALQSQTWLQEPSVKRCPLLIVC